MQQVWRKRWRNSGWFALAAITLVLLVAGIQKKNNKICTGLEVSINGDGNNYFIDEKGVGAVLKSEGFVKGLPIESIDLKALETRLKNNLWIADAQLFFDNKQVLQALVTEKEPVARIFTVGGSSFYIDSACQKLPLSEKLSARIPMFTNFPSDKSKLSKPDSALLASVKQVARYIQADEFWKAQVAQIDITPDGFEMIPTVGNHIVRLGKGENIEKKFDRLFSFYKEVWTKVGFERYEMLDVQFDGQVVATVKGAKTSIVDSAKAKEAVENLLEEVKRRQADSIPAMLVKATLSKEATAKPVVPVLADAVPDNNAEVRQLLPSPENLKESGKATVEQHVKKQQHSMQVKQNASAKTEKTQSAVVAAGNKQEVKKTPKAVMQKPKK